MTKAKIFKIGDTLGHLTVINIEPTKKENIIVQCECDEKLIFAISEDNLAHKFKLHCTSLNCKYNAGNSFVFERVKYTLIIDAKIGQFTVIDIEKSANGTRFFVLLCNCGNIARLKKNQLENRREMCCNTCYKK